MNRAIAVRVKNISIVMAKPHKPIPIKGIRTAAVVAGIRYRGRKDIALVELSEETHTAVCFTRNAFKAAPVILSEKHLEAAQPRYLLINAGNANAGTGSEGIDDAEACCLKVARHASITAEDDKDDTEVSHRSIAVEQVLPFSTGVIGERLPVSKITKVIPEVFGTLAPDNWEAVAQAIMTTDTFAKWFSKEVLVGTKTVSITGVAKGSGMICPDMATMLAYVATDIKADQQTLKCLLQDALAVSFNCITVDGDMSTNDACVLLASGACGVDWASLGTSDKEIFFEALKTVMQELAKMIVRDGEGASHFIEIQVEQARSREEARQVAYTIAHSPLVKTAFAAADPNWGRIIAAVGRSGLESLDMNKVSCFIGDHRLYHCGTLDPDYDEAIAKAAMEKPEVGLRVLLDRGAESALIWTSDLTEDYVRINAEYRS